MMAANPLTDCFHYCWPVLLKETAKSSALFFAEKDFSIEDSRDADFDKIANRLAYMNKFGHINATLVEKCVEEFFDAYFQGDKNYFSQNLNVCSLSNGPGIDIIGFLRALYKTKQPKCIPVLQALNVHGSWRDAYQDLICSAYRAYNSKFHEIHAVVPPDNIQFMQCDIFSMLSPELQSTIRSCDILLMLKVFASSKAPQGVFFDAVQKIFSCLKPGALIFFFGGKKNIKEITEKEDLKKYVKCVFGPKEMDLQKLSAYEIISKSVTLKPNLYGKVKFIVLQKKLVPEVTDMNSSQNTTEIKKKKRKKAKKKKKAVVTPTPNGLPLNTTTLNDSEAENDTYSESSYTSSSKQSETFSIQSQHLSHENKLQSVTSQSVNNTNPAIEKKQALNLHVESTSLLENAPPSFEKTAERVSSFIKKDAFNEKYSTGELPQDKLSFINKFLSHDEIAVKNASTATNQSVQPDKPTKAHFTNDALPVIVDMTSKKLEKIETIASKHILPSVSLPHTGLFQSPKMTACKEPVKQNAGNDKNKLTKISKKKECLLHTNCNSNSVEKTNSETPSAAKLAAPKQFQSDGKGTFSEQFVDVTENGDLHSMLQRCETLVASLERAVAGICTDMQSLQNSEVPMQECCPGDVRCALRNSHCNVHYYNFPGHSCCRKICHCMRTQNNGLTRPNYVRCTERINGTHRCRSETSPEPYLVIPVQNEDIPQIFPFISR